MLTKNDCNLYYTYVTLTSNKCELVNVGKQKKLIQAKKVSIREVTQVAVGCVSHVDSRWVYISLSEVLYNTCSLVECICKLYTMQ